MIAISNGGLLNHGGDTPATLADCLYRAAERSADRGIVYLHDDSETFQSYPALLREAQQLLGGLTEFGLKAGDLVILQFERNQDFIRSFWACILGGFVPLPMPAGAIQPTTSAAGKLHNSWKYFGHPVILSSGASIDSVKSCFNDHELLDLRIGVIESLKVAGGVREHRGQADDLALLMLTSGSTGAAKAVQLSHANLLSRSYGSIQMNGFSSRDIALNWMPLEHVAGLVYFHIRDVYLGCQQVHVPTELILADPLKWLGLIDRYKVSISFAPNFAYGLINSFAHEFSEYNWDLSPLRVLLNGGETIVAKTARQFLKFLSPFGLSPTVMRPAWGMSETSSGVTYSDSFSLATTTDKDLFVAVGRPIPGVSLRIVDAQNNAVEEEVIGSLQVKGMPVTAGYYGNAQASRDLFTSDGWLQTGDLGFLKGGSLTITGRQKDIVIINGAKYSSHEIEAVIEEISGVESSYTVAGNVRDEEANTERLAVFFHPYSDEPRFLSRVMGDIRESMVLKLGIRPYYLLPMEKKDIPKSAIGKIQRSELLNRFDAGEFRPVLQRVAKLKPSFNAAHVSPRTPIEKLLAEIWADVLGTSNVGINDNFLDLGGDSVAATQIVHRVLNQLQVEISLKALLKSLTVAEMAAFIIEHRARALDRDALERLLSELESISEKEAEQIFDHAAGRTG